MNNDPDSVTLKLSNAARMVLNAIATETGPLIDAELYLVACDLVALLSAVPNTFKVGEQEVDIPRALAGAERLAPDDAQRIGVEQLSAKWGTIEIEMTLPRQFAAVLILQMQWILQNQGLRQTTVRLPMTVVCGEVVRALDQVK